MNNFSLEEISSSFFSSFDNRGERVPDFVKLEELFDPRALITKHSAGGVDVMNVKDFIGTRERILTDGTITEFNEWETEAKVIMEKGIAARISKYKKTWLSDGQRFTGEGTKHIQFIMTPDGWKIISLLWEDL